MWKSSNIYKKNGEEYRGPYILIYTHNPASTSIDSWPNLFHYTPTDLPNPHFSMDFLKQIHVMILLGERLFFGPLKFLQILLDGPRCQGPDCFHQAHCSRLIVYSVTLRNEVTSPPHPSTLHSHPWTNSRSFLLLLFAVRLVSSPNSVFHSCEATHCTCSYPSVLPRWHRKQGDPKQIC